MRFSKLIVAAALAALCLASSASYAALRAVAGGGGGGGSGTVTSIGTGCGLAGGTITTSGTVYGSSVVNAQTGTTYTVLAGDCGKLVTTTNAAAVAVTLPQAGGTFPTGFPDGWRACFKNQGAGTATITPTTSTIDGNASLALATGEGACVFSDGTNYETTGLIGGSSGSTAFSAITTGTNTTATMTVGSGASIVATGTGAITATGVPVGGVTGLGTGVLAALGVNIGSAGAPVLYNGAGGTPSSITLTNGTGLPVGGVTGLGTGVATSLGVANNASGGYAPLNGTITSGNLVDFSSGLHDSGIATSSIKPLLYNAQVALGTTAIASGACATVITETATGLATTNTISLTYTATPVGVTGYNPSTTTGSLQVTAYPTANAVNISVCNPTASSITPAAMSVNVVAY